jgi:SseB protein C-terminal domain/SseB protein N-terminal domain
MTHGGISVRADAVVWGPDGPRSRPAPAAQPVPPAAIEDALTDAAEDPDRVTDLLDELSRGRLWLPLPDDERPVTDGSAVLLPTVTYLGAEFVPAFTSARQLADWHGRARLAGQLPVPASRRPDEPPRPRLGDGLDAAMPHIVVPAAELARRLPAGVGIALNPGARASVPIYPEGVGYLAADQIPLVVTDGIPARVGRPPADPVTLLAEIRSALRSVPDVQQAARAWLSVPGHGEGLVISVTLDHPAAEATQKEVITATEQAVSMVPEQGFPIDVLFPGEGDPDQVEEWIAGHAEAFYTRV